MMNGPGKSDRLVVPEKPSNNAGQPAAKRAEGRGLAKGNLPQQNASRTPSRCNAPTALERVRQAAKKDKDRELRFTALLHHIYNLETLRMAYFRLKKEAAPGVDGETWRHYGERLEVNLQDLSERLKREAYRAKPVRRVYIPNADGRVNWVLDLDIKGFFDGISHEWLVKFVEHRIADRRVVRLIQKWLKAGVSEDGKRIVVEE
jgi:RNA-directed DNA polymerase